MQGLHLLIGLVAATALASAGAQAPSGQAGASPLGRWVTASGNLEVEIAPCGAALCGVVTQVLGNRSMSREGQEMQPVDTRPALGMKILRDFVPESTQGERPTRWEGEIHNRENGKTYACQMSVGADGGLVLRPYVGLPLFGKTQVWQRATPPARPADAR